MSEEIRMFTTSADTKPSAPNPWTLLTLPPSGPLHEEAEVPEKICLLLHVYPSCQFLLVSWWLHVSFQAWLHHCVPSCSYSRPLPLQCSFLPMDLHRLHAVSCHALSTLRLYTLSAVREHIFLPGGQGLSAHGQFCEALRSHQPGRAFLK